MGHWFMVGYNYDSYLIITSNQAPNIIYETTRGLRDYLWLLFDQLKTTETIILLLKKKCIVNQLKIQVLLYIFVKLY